MRSITNTPLEVFRVQKGQRYRFRFVNSLSHNCPAQLDIENHTLLMIASDSYDFKPVEVDSFLSTSGERYDFVLTANQTGGKFNYN
jgi:FtsP/CotA-like multicopper oxidase with cupredoxin domain